MTNYLPANCRANAFEFMQAQLPHLQSNEGLLRAAIAISLHQLDVLPAEVERGVSSLSGCIRNRLRGSQRRALLAHLHDELFERRGFRGNTVAYYEPANSYVPTILESGLGIPVSLSLLYTVVARRLGLRADGINSPGHFLVQVTDETGSILVDPFQSGRQLSRDDARRLVFESLPPGVPFSDDMLRPATHQQWIERMLRNLVRSFQCKGDEPNAMAMVELLELVQQERES